MSVYTMLIFILFTCIFKNNLLFGIQRFFLVAIDNKVMSRKKKGETKPAVLCFCLLYIQYT